MNVLDQLNFLLRNPRDIHAQGKRRASAILAFQCFHFIGPVHVLKPGPYARQRFR